MIIFCLRFWNLYFFVVTVHMHEFYGFCKKNFLIGLQACSLHSIVSDTCENLTNPRIPRQTFPVEYLRVLMMPATSASSPCLLFCTCELNHPLNPMADLHSGIPQSPQAEGLLTSAEYPCAVLYVWNDPTSESQNWSAASIHCSIPQSSLVDGLLTSAEYPCAVLYLWNGPSSES